MHREPPIRTQGTFSLNGEGQLDNKPQLHETVAHATLVLGEEHAAQFRQRRGRIFQHSQDCLAILNGERHQVLFRVERQKEHISGVLAPGSEQELSK